jgi:hypothetical protein
MAAAALVLCSQQAHAEQPRKAGCSERSSELAGKLGLVAEHQRNPADFTAKFDDGRIRIVCSKSATWPTIVLNYPAEYPPKSFYELVAKAASSVSKRPPERARLRAHLCHRAAKRTPNGHSHTRLESFRLECVRTLTRSTFVLRPQSSPGV